MGPGEREQPTPPRWAEWRTGGDPTPPYTVGIEEEVMLLDPAAGWTLAHRGEEALSLVGDAFGGRACGELHRATLEVQTAPHARVADAIAELRSLRAAVADAVEPIGLRLAGAGTHPFHDLDATEVSSGRRYAHLRALLRGLALREPTFALHVHVGVPDPEAAMRLFGSLRRHIPLLIALSGSSPFWRGRDSGFASSRTFLFQAFPRSGLPRPYSSYADWTRAVGLLIGSGAIDDPTYIWWDVRPQPRFGTVEVRVMDTQSRLRETASLVALVQSLARLALEEGRSPAAGSEVPDEVLHENRFLAARDGATAGFVDPALGATRPVRELAAELLTQLRPHARALGCDAELDGVSELLREPSAARQRAIVAEAGGDCSVLVERLADAFLD